ncbi:hypothetical protein Tco_0548573 [Tanacetum coccineum]
MLLGITYYCWFKLMLLSINLLLLLKVNVVEGIPQDIFHSSNTVLMNSSSKNNVGGVTHISCTECQKADVTHIVDFVIPRLLLKAKKQKPRKSKRKDTEVPQPSGPTTNVADEAVYEEMDDSLERNATTTTSLDVKQDRGINLVSTHFDDDTDMFRVHDLVGNEVVVEREVVVKAASTILVSAATTTITVITNDDITLAKELSQLKRIMVEEPVKMKKKDQMSLDEELAFKLQAEEEEEEETRKKHFAAIRAKEKRNTPPTKAQKRNTMSTYLKNMAGYKHNQLKNKSFDDIQKLFDKAMKKSISKRAGDELEHENPKKQKVDEDKETAELQRLIKVVFDEEEVAIDVVPLATKPPTIVNWKIHKEGKKSYYQIIRADGSLKMYIVFSLMLKSFDREDLETLYKLVKAKYGLTRPVEDLDLILYGDLKKMFEPHIYKPEVKGTSSLSTNTQNVSFVSSNSTSSTNGAVNTARGATTASTQATTVNSTTINNLSDAVICAFFASQPNSPQLDNEDLQQIHPDDIE